MSLDAYDAVAALQQLGYRKCLAAGHAYVTRARLGVPRRLCVRCGLLAPKGGEWSQGPPGGATSTATGSAPGLDRIVRPSTEGPG